MLFRYRYDTETGLYYLQSRYYNAEWGRFVNADVIAGAMGELLSHNMFAYCQNNPINMSDSSGYFPIWDILDIGFAAMSWGEFASRPSWGGFGMALLDTAGCLPIVPSTGYVTRTAKTVDKVDEVVDTVQWAGKADDFVKTPFVPDEYWKRNAPDFNTPGSKITHFKDNKGVIEKSTVIYDDFGRQKWRVDYNNHGYKDHSIPHLHERTFGPGLDPVFGKEIRYDWWR